MIKLCRIYFCFYIWDWMLTNGSKQSFHNYLVYLTSGSENRRSPARPAKQVLTSLLLTVTTPWLSPSSISTLIHCRTGIPYKCQQIIISQSELKLTALLNLCNNCHVEVSVYWYFVLAWNEPAKSVSHNTFYIFLSALSSYTIYSRQMLCWCRPDRKYRQSVLNLPTLNHVIAIPSNDRRDDQQKYNNYQHLLVSFSPKAKHF